MFNTQIILKLNYCICIVLYIVFKLISCKKIYFQVYETVLLSQY